MLNSKETILIDDLMTGVPWTQERLDKLNKWYRKIFAKRLNEAAVSLPVRIHESELNGNKNKLGYEHLMTPTDWFRVNAFESEYEYAKARQQLPRIEKDDE